MSTVKVTVAETPIQVSVSDGTPKVTITNNQTAQVSVVEASTVSVIPVNQQPKVIVNTGVGSQYDLTTMLTMLSGVLDPTHMDASLQTDLEDLRDLWARVGTQLDLLTKDDELNITQVAQSYTDGKVSTEVGNLKTTLEGDIALEVSSITQTTNAIDQKIDVFKQESDGDFLAQSSRILQTELGISQSVTRLNDIDGDISLANSAIDQNVDSIVLEVEARELVDDDLQETKSELALAKDSIIAAVTSVDEASEQMEASMLILGENGVEISAIKQSVGDTVYSLGAVQTLLNNQWGVVIEEDVGGNTYASGFKLILHPNWLLGSAYTTEHTVYHDGSVYACILAHTASAVNNPTGTSGSTYWLEKPEGVKSVFSIKADQFYIQGPNGPQALFSVNTETGVVRVNADLIVSTLVSNNYPNAGEPWFSFDPTTGQAHINNMTMTFSGSSERTAAQAALNVANGADVTGSNTAYDTARVGGTAASTVRDNAAAGAALGASLGDMAYENLVELAKLGDTVIEGGYFKNTLINTSAIVVEDSMLGTSIIQGGYFKNDLINTGTLIVGGIVNQGLLATRNSPPLYSLGLTHFNGTVITNNRLTTGLVTADTVGANEIITQSGNIADLTVDTLQIAGDAVSITAANWSGTSRDISTPSFAVASGQSVLIVASMVAGINCNMFITEQRSGSSAVQIFSATPAGGGIPCYTRVRTPAAGTYTYRLYSTTASTNVNQLSISVRLAKK